VTNNNKLTEDNIKSILSLVEERKEKVEHRSRLVHRDEIAENDFNLSVSTYVEQKDTREKIDIVKLEAELKEIVAKEAKLRAAIDKIVAELSGGTGLTPAQPNRRVK
jgi:type I restriction enzyme M protein